MDRTLNIAIVGAAVTVLVLVVFYGPLAAGFIVAASSFALAIGMIVMAVVQALGRWRRGHRARLRRTKTH
jgi:hypothetical protein